MPADKVSMAIWTRDCPAIVVKFPMTSSFVPSGETSSSCDVRGAAVEQPGDGHVHERVDRSRHRIDRGDLGAGDVVDLDESTTDDDLVPPQGHVVDRATSRGVEGRDACTRRRVQLGDTGRGGACDRRERPGDDDVAVWSDEHRGDGAVGVRVEGRVHHAGRGVERQDAVPGDVRGAALVPHRRERTGRRSSGCRPARWRGPYRSGSAA